MAWSQYIGRKRETFSGLDRLVPKCDLDYASCLVTGGKTAHEILCHTKTYGFASNVAYQEVLAKELNMNRANVFSYGKAELISSLPTFTVKKKKNWRIPQDPVQSLDAPGLVDDFSLNLLDWGSNNVLAVALQDIVNLWNASDESTNGIELKGGIVTSVRWAPNARHIAFGMCDSQVHIMDCETLKLVRTLSGCHNGRVGVLAWNSDHMITTGGRDHCIVNNDLRVQSQVKETYRGHRQEVCGLVWSSSGETLASGGLDSRVFIWDTRQSQWLQKLEGHKGAIKALAWCPDQRNLLATGDDRCIKFWNARSRSCLNSIDTGSQVTALLWNHHERELLSSHGLSKNQLILWDYPSMVRRAEIFGHTSRILNMSQSPDGTVVSAAAGDDESLKFWNVFGEVPKPVEKEDNRPFAHLIYHFR